MPVGGWTSYQMSTSHRGAELVLGRPCSAKWPHKRAANHWVRGQEGKREQVQSESRSHHEYRQAPLRYPSCCMGLWAGATIPGGQSDKE